MNPTRLLQLVAWVSALGVSAAATVAQTAAQAEPLRLPRIEQTPSSPKFWMYAVFILLLALVVFAASLKSKRSHQD